MENLLIGAAILEPRIIPRIRSEIGLVPDSMSLDMNRVFLQALYEMDDRGTPVDVSTVAKQVASRGEIEYLTALTYGMELESGVPHAANSKYHATCIKDAATLRSVIKRCGDISEMCYTGSGVPEVLEQLEATTRNIAGGVIQSILHAPDVGMEVLKQLEAMANGNAGENFYLTTGHTELDRQIVGFFPGELYIVGARPAMGKSALAHSWAAHSAFKANAPVGIWSGEMGDKQMVRRHIVMHTGICSKRLKRGEIYDHEWPLIQEAISKTKNIYLDPTTGPSIQQLRAMARRMVAEKGIRMFIVDYIQIANGAGKNREQEISSISRGLKEMAVELEIPVIGLAQLNRSVEMRQDKKPVLSDLRESGSMEQDADVVMFIYRPEYYGLKAYDDGTSTSGVAEIIIAKQRDGDLGEVKLNFQHTRTRFVDLDSFGYDPDKFTGG